MCAYLEYCNECKFLFIFKPHNTNVFKQILGNAQKLIYDGINQIFQKLSCILSVFHIAAGGFHVNPGACFVEI